MLLTMQSFIPRVESWCAAHKRYHPNNVPCHACVEDVEEAAPYGDTIEGTDHFGAHLVASFAAGAMMAPIDVTVYVCIHCRGVRRRMGTTGCVVCCGSGLFFAAAGASLANTR